MLRDEDVAKLPAEDLVLLREELREEFERMRPDSASALALQEQIAVIDAGIDRRLRKGDPELDRILQLPPQEAGSPRVRVQVDPRGVQPLSGTIPEIRLAPRRETVLLPSDKRLRQANPELWRQYDTHYPDSKHPVRSVLVLELTRRWSYLCAPPELMHHKALPPLTEADRKERIENLVFSQLEDWEPLQAEVSELLSWLTPPLTTEMRQEAVPAVAKSMLDAGHSSEVASRIVSAFSKTPGGRPVSRRLLAVKALEMRLSDPQRWSWMQLALKLCDCGTNHDRGCAQRMRQEVILLQELLKKYGHEIRALNPD